MKKDPELQIERLESLLAQRGWKPGELAERAGLAYNTIYKIRTGERARTSAEVLAKLAIALDCSADYLLGLTDNPVPRYSETLNPVLHELCSVAQALPVSRQRDLTRIAEALQVLGESEPQDDLHTEMMQVVLQEVQRISGNDALNEVLGRLEAAFPDQSAALTARVRRGR